MTKEFSLSEKYFVLAEQHQALEVDYSIVQQDLREALDALKTIDDMLHGDLPITNAVKEIARAVLVKHGRTV